MTAQEKAKELVKKFKNFEYPSTIGSEFNEIHKNPFRVAKQCALIAVDEIMDSYKSTNSHNGSVYKYWQQVKEEIKNYE